MGDHLYDEARRLRDVDADFAVELEAQDQADAPPCAAAAACRTVSGGSYPTAAQCFFKCERYRITGTQAEGWPLTETATGTYLYAFNIGNAIPPVGTRVLAVYSGYRWEFNYGS